MNDPHAIVIDALPSVPFTERRMLPACPALYFAVSKEGTVLYIGQTESLYHRWIQHNRMRELMEFECALIAWHACSIDQLRERESQCIKQFQPLLNGIQGIPIEKAEKITVSMYPSRWHAFRVACLQRKTSASAELQRLIAQQLAAWQHQTQKETDHA